MCSCSGSGGNSMFLAFNCELHPTCACKVYVRACSYMCINMFAHVYFIIIVDSCLYLGCAIAVATKD